ncbi:hypothetical protein K466DRAFT_604241 [Polyporus arcularius HHB13444]|uniref:t-SNARE coiled-coil homology domain-containing protein n=1 Tax=Polyporus arcularius HHB13444 TaxID=1314778 RepID=A0A5C3NZ00_9APHY|nr:hypothetical protein K466DRAFT_604241 [Polyporus arcularius HHB13444]
MAPRTKKAADAIDKRRSRQQHIILQTLPPLVFSTPTNTVTIRFTMATPDVKQTRPQSSGTFGGDRHSQHSVDRHSQHSGDLPVDSADIAYVQQTVQHLEYRIGQQITSVKQELTQRVDSLDAKFVTLDAKVDRLDAKAVSLDRKIDGVESTMNKGFHGVDLRFIELYRTTKERFAEVDERFNKVDKRFNKVDERFNKVDERFNKVDERFNKVDERFDKVDERFNRLEGEMNERFNKLEGEMKSMRDDIRTMMLLLQMQQGAPTQSPPRIVEHPPSSHSHDAASGFTRSRYVSDASQSSAAGPSSPRHRQGPSAEASGDEASLSASEREATAHNVLRKIGRLARYGSRIFRRTGEDSAQ